MRIRLTVEGVPDLRRHLGGADVEVATAGSTLGDLLRWLQTTQGNPAGVRVCDPQGRADPALQVLRNGSWVDGRDPGLPLTDGDRVKLFVLVAGG